jgi:hypothetical protein
MTKLLSKLFSLKTLGQKKPGQVIRHDVTSSIMWTSFFRHIDPPSAKGHASSRPTNADRPQFRVNINFNSDHFAMFNKEWDIGSLGEEISL